MKGAKLETILRWSYLKPEFGGKAPSKAHKTDSGFDFHALRDEIIYSGQIVKIDTNICVQPAVEHLQLEDARMYNKPGGWTLGAFLWDKSGHGSRGLKVLGGVIDNGYTGHVQVIIGYCSLEQEIDNLRKQIRIIRDGIRAGLSDSVPYNKNAYDEMMKEDDMPALSCHRFNAGDKVAQLVVQRVELPILQFEERLQDRERGANGFGSSGV